MPRKARARPAAITLLIFEIERWEPEYHFSINGHRDRDGPYSEITLIEVHTVCRYPKKVVGRPARFDLYAERDMWEPSAWDRDRRPSDIGYLELPPSNGRCFARLPHESMSGLMTALAHGRFRYVSLHSAPLLRGRCLCHSIGFSTDEGLDEA
jgi:hypothetical protein